MFELSSEASSSYEYFLGKAKVTLNISKHFYISLYLEDLTNLELITFRPLKNNIKIN